jgi:hypothetical protein
VFLEPLSHTYTFLIRNFPRRWLPLIHLYDPDLPLFPIYYFHVIPDLTSESRIYGFVDQIRPVSSGLEVSVICNKDPEGSTNSHHWKIVELEICERLGISNPVNFNDVSAAFRTPLNHVNVFLSELWKRIVPEPLGGLLPFGRFYDAVFGLVRMVSTFNPPAGRKSELIQTHYFLSKFGERIEITLESPKVNFYLLPTYRELTSGAPPTTFRKFKALCDAVDDFCAEFCEIKKLNDKLSFSRFSRQPGKQLDTENLLGWIDSLKPESREPLIQCFNAFDKGPRRMVLFILMLKDLRDGRLLPQEMTSADFGLIYDRLSGFYQSPKVLNLYAQQCFGNPSAFPIDTWIETFMEWPLWIYQRGSNLRDIFECSQNLGKIERLMWLAAQSRKVHSPLCDDILWCTKFDSLGKPRGANPLACCACSPKIRNSCPGFARIAEKIVSFNTDARAGSFSIKTSGGNNRQPDQHFIVCEGMLEGKVAHDDFTPVDVPEIFRSFPRLPHRGEPLPVREFVAIYRKDDA